MESPKPRIDSIRFYTSKPQRPRPKTGDRRATKKHGVQIRIPCRTREGHHIVNSRGQATFDWRTPAQIIGTRWEYLLTDAERTPAQKDSK